MSTVDFSVKTDFSDVISKKLAILFFQIQKSIYIFLQ